MSMNLIVDAIEQSLLKQKQKQNEAAKDVRLSIDGNERVIHGHDSYLISEALKMYAKELRNGSLDERDVKGLISVFEKLAWPEDDNPKEKE